MREGQLPLSLGCLRSIHRWRSTRPCRVARVLKHAAALPMPSSARDSQMFLASVLLATLLSCSLLVFAQTTNATCEVSHKWAFNSQKQSPCEVASALVAVCTGSYEVAALPPGFHYNGPPDMQSANDCWCNTVVYSLFSECALCQDNSFIMWSLWEINCNTVTRNAFPQPIPAGLHVPGWAYQDVETSDQFNETLAFANANITESTAAPQPSKTAASSVPPSTSSTSSASAETTAVAPASDVSGDPPVNQKRINAIGGGVVGGLAALVLFGGLAIYLYRRRHIGQTQGAILKSPAMSEHRTDAALPSQPSQPSVPSITVSSLHSQHGAGSEYSPV
ncbi:hypothetical protein C8F01DRAFT_79056 [Mycena amicta]|nr:hypothetical protein C8F01DRAFT_79056 [Mycena amicta]